MPDNPGERENTYQRVLKAWKSGIDNETIDAAKKFAGMTYVEFLAKVQPSIDARNTLADLELQVTEWQDNRDDADKDTLKQVKLVINSIKGDPEFGEDCALIEEAGYKRASEKKSGLTRKPKASKTKAVNDKPAG